MEEEILMAFKSFEAVDTIRRKHGSNLLDADIEFLKTKVIQ